MVLAAQAGRLLSVSPGAAQARLRALGQAGYVRRERPFEGRAWFHLITARGLAAAGSQLRAPQLDLGSWQHDVGLGWLWLAAHCGAFGPLREVVSERRMRSLDGALAAHGRADAPQGVRLGGVGPAGRQRLHYPDLLLVGGRGERIAVELELSAKGRRRREQILSGYAGEGRIDAVLYLVRSRAVGRAVRASARRIGIGHLVQVQEARVASASPRSSARGGILARPGSLRAGREADR